jgi:hypothetical protein
LPVIYYLMNAFLQYAVVIVNIALISYTVAFVIMSREKKITKLFISMLTAGIFFDTSSVVLMVAGSPNNPLTPHGIIGYSALLIMITERVYFYRLTVKNGMGVTLNSKKRHFFTAAYIYWILAYLTGAVIVILKYSK